MSLYKLKAVKTKKTGIVSALINQPGTFGFDWYRIPLTGYVDGDWENRSTVSTKLLWKKITGMEFQELLELKKELDQFQEGYVGNKENRFFKRVEHAIGRLKAVLPEKLKLGADVTANAKRINSFQKFTKPAYEVDIKWTHVL